MKVLLPVARIQSLTSETCAIMETDNKLVGCGLGTSYTFVFLFSLYKVAISMHLLATIHLGRPYWRNTDNYHLTRDKNISTLPLEYEIKFFPKFSFLKWESHVNSMNMLYWDPSNVALMFQMSCLTYKRSYHERNRVNMHLAGCQVLMMVFCLPNSASQVGKSMLII